jgi:hypothetical protein
MSFHRLPRRMTTAMTSRSRMASMLVSTGKQGPMLP